MENYILKKKLKFKASHRGTKEMDALVGVFVEKNIDTLDYDDLNALEVVLEMSDHELFDLIYRDDNKINPGYVKLIEKIRRFKNEIQEKKI